MKNIIKIAFICLLSTILQLQASEWDLKNINFQTENDSDTSNDEAYSYGSSISLLFLRKDLQDSILHIPFTDYKNTDNYISFAYAHQIYTPGEIEFFELLPLDRPYAGYGYIESGLYQSSNNNLKSLNIQIGMVGPSAGMEAIQKVIHKLIGSPKVNGWPNQLKDEVTFQLNYSEKQYYNLDNIFGLNNSSSIIPEYGVNLGNVSTKIYGAALFRYGLNVTKDYGSSQIDNTTYNRISLDADYDYKNDNRWRVFLNISAKANLIARNIFLDGNTNKDSHSVDKNNFVMTGSYGISIAYNQYSFDYIRTHTSKEYKTQDELYSYGSLLFSYNF